MKRMKYIILFLMLFLPFSVSGKEYDITNYYIDVNVNKNNIYNINEYYNLLFFEDANFERKILLRPKVYLTNGKFISYVTQVINLQASHNITEKYDSKNHFIIFPKSKQYQTETYKLSYYYNMGNDLENDSDIVFVNIVDGTFNTISEAFSFSITLPNDINKEQITFLKNGTLLTDKTGNIDYTISGNRINGMIYEDVSLGDIISIRISLPDGYFKNTIQTDSNIAYLLIVLPIIALLVGIYATRKYKKGKIKINDSLNIVANFDSAEVAYLYRGDINITDLLSLIFHLANEGYITFKNYGSKENVYFKIKKIKEYDKDNAAQKIIFDGLFQNKDEVDIHGVEGVFHPYYVDAKRTLVNMKNKKRLFYDFVKIYKNVLLITAYVGMVLLQIKPLYNYFDSYEPAIAISFIVSLVVTFLYHIKNKLVRISLFIISLTFILLNINLLMDFRLSLWVYCIGMLLILVALFLEHRIPIRTIYGEQMLHNMNNFRLELASMTEEIFHERADENPNYFFDMIPYMIVFDLNGWWFKRFKNQITSPPNWYESSESYTSEKLEEFINEVIHQLIVPVQTTKLYEDELLSQARNKLL